MNFFVDTRCVETIITGRHCPNVYSGSSQSPRRVIRRRPRRPMWEIIKERQKLYDQQRQARDRVMRGHQISAQEDLWTWESFSYESDFVQTKNFMAEGDCMAENLFRSQLDVVTRLR